MSIKSSVTVVIPTFNSSNLIKDSILSVLNQTIQVESIIIVDDCSLDFNDTKIIYDYFKKKFQKINFELIKNKQNCGPGKSRNLAWSLVKTKYIAFLDSDDIWHANKLEKQLLVFSQNRNVILVSAAKNKKTKFLSTGQISIKQLLYRNLIPLSSVLLKTNIPFRFTEAYYSEDYDLWLKLLTNDLKIYFLNEVLCTENINVINKKRLSSNYIYMTVQTQISLSKIYKKKLNLFFFIIFAQFFELFKFLLRLIKIKNV